MASRGRATGLKKESDMYVSLWKKDPTSYIF